VGDIKISVWCCCFGVVSTLFRLRLLPTYSRGRLAVVSIVPLICGASLTVIIKLSGNSLRSDIARLPC